MKQLLICVTAVCLSLVASADAKFFYYGPTSQEGVLTYSAFVDLKSETPPTDEQARWQIQKQYFYMLGNLRWGVEGMPATPSKQYELSSMTIAPSDVAGVYRIAYSATTNVALEKAQVTGELKFSIPRDPSLMEALTDKACTNDKYHVLWYGFNPHLEGCGLIEGKDYDVISGHVEVKANTVETYPEYQKLVAADGMIHMTIMLNQEITKSEGTIAKLTAEGFARHTWTSDEITAHVGFTPTEMPQVDDFVLKGPKRGIKITVFYGNTNINKPGAKAFHYFYKKSLEEDGIVVYSGHSEYGNNVDLARIEKLQNFKILVNPNYQIYFLAGCITYAYFTDMYLERKATPEDVRGTKNLDVIEFGTASPGYDDKPLFAVTEALIGFARSGTLTTYQSIPDRIPYSWFAVVGDEDNGGPF